MAVHKSFHKPQAEASAPAAASSGRTRGKRQEDSPEDEPKTGWEMDSEEEATPLRRERRKPAREQSFASRAIDVTW